jgi:hypothetical protein
VIVPFRWWLVGIGLVFASQAVAQQPRQKPQVLATSNSLLWREPVDIKTRDLFNGPGGRLRQPKGRLTFLQEDLDDTRPKFLVTDEAGVRWKIKLGSEAQPEVAATRLVWAVGYFVDENYYLARVKVENLPRLRRGAEFVLPDGTVYGARIERDERSTEKHRAWPWFHNPFDGTAELNGLRVVMALINNWDLTTENNAIHDRQGVAGAYLVGDLGATFGRVSGGWMPTRNNPHDYADSLFIRAVSSKTVGFNARSCTKVLAVLYIFPHYYWQCTRSNLVLEHIPLAHAAWVAGWLSRLSQEQIADAFRAAGYSSEEVATLSTAVHERIAALNGLPKPDASRRRGGRR